ncbi:MAG: hypothetical protein HY259_02455 [Chloroflexi bacterium]|nr:hypothetical protein [Chloroflexota bacterium]
MNNSFRQGARVWYIPDGYLPTPTGEPGALISHEAVCLLNVTRQTANVTLTVFFEDREPIRDIRFTLGAERTWHVRLDKPEALGGVEIPRGVPYALRVECDVPVIVQHSRMDVSQPSLALFTTMGWPGE